MLKRKKRKLNNNNLFNKAKKDLLKTIIGLQFAKIAKKLSCM
jgi:hypothetical protein